MSKKISNVFVKESNAIARAEIIPAPESIWEERFIAKVATFNRMDSVEFPESVFKVGEFIEKNLSGSQLKQLEKAVTNLTGARFKIKESATRFSVYPIFSVVKYDDGVITAKFNPELRAHYLVLKEQFAIRSLPEFNSLSSVYSQSLFRFLNSWKGLEETVIPIGQLHSILNVPESSKKDFKAFRTRILEPAHCEITEKTSLYYDWEPVREGLRKVVAIRFIFRESMNFTVLTAEDVEKQKRLQELEELNKLQFDSNACWERKYRSGKPCEKPNLRYKKCRYCDERGRMAAEKLRCKYYPPRDTESVE